MTEGLVVLANIINEATARVMPTVCTVECIDGVVYRTTPRGQRFHLEPPLEVRAWWNTYSVRVPEDRPLDSVGFRILDL